MGDPANFEATRALLSGNEQSHKVPFIHNAVINSPLNQRTNTSSLRKRGTNALSSRVEKAVHLKDEQLKLLQGQNKELLKTIECMEIEIEGEKKRVDQQQSVILKIQDENIILKTKLRRTSDEVRIACEAAFQRQVESSQHQTQVMAAQNTELLKMLKSEEAKLSGVRSELSILEKKYKSTVSHLEHIRGEMEVNREELFAKLQKSQQREKELNHELERKMERVRGQRITIKSQEEKLIKVSNANVELNHILLDSQRAANNAKEVIQNTTAKSINDLEKETSDVKLQLKLKTQELEHFRIDAESQSNQLKEMAEKVFLLIDRVKDAESMKIPLENTIARQKNDIKSAKTRLIRVEIERDEAEKEARRFGVELRKMKSVTKKTIVKLDGLKKLSSSEKLLRNREQRAKREIEESYKALSGRVSYLLNKSALDEESRANARIDVKKLEHQCREMNKTVENLRAKLRNAKETNKVLSEAMRLKEEEVEKLHVHSKLREWTKKSNNRTEVSDKQHAFGKRNADKIGTGNNLKSMNIPTQAERKSRKIVSSGTIFSVVVPIHSKNKSHIYVKAKKGDSHSKRVLEKLQINEFFLYLSSRPQKKRMEIVALKMTQILGALRVSEALSASRGRKAQIFSDRLQSEIDMLRRKAQYQAERILEEEEAKRKALVKYLSSMIKKKATYAFPEDNIPKKTAVLGKKQNAEDTLSEQRDESKEAASIVGINNPSKLTTPVYEPSKSRLPGHKLGISLRDCRVGDEEIHALVAILSPNDNVQVIDLTNNQITNTGCRGIATYLRMTRNLEVLDLRGNEIGMVGIRILAEAVEHNGRVKHVFVHDKQRIEALGNNSMDEQIQGQVTTSDKDKTTEKKNRTTEDETGYVQTTLVISIGDQNNSRVTEGDKKPTFQANFTSYPTSEDNRLNKTPLDKRIIDMESHIGLVANAPSETLESEAEKWVIRAENIDKTRGINKIRKAKGEEPYEFDYLLLCNKICGASHYNMQMKITVVEQEEYDKWIAEQPTLATVIK